MGVRSWLVQIIQGKSNFPKSLSILKWKMQLIVCFCDCNGTAMREIPIISIISISLTKEKIAIAINNSNEQFTIHGVLLIFRKKSQFSGCLGIFWFERTFHHREICCSMGNQNSETISQEILRIILHLIYVLPVFKYCQIFTIVRKS